jgi:amino acid adenylation domain-containing protein
MSSTIQVQNVALSAAESRPSAQRGSTAPPITRRPPGTRAPLSFAQQDVWSRAQLATGAPISNQVLILNRKGPLNRDALEQAISEISRRHAALRTNFETGDGGPVQVSDKHKSVELAVSDLRGPLGQSSKLDVLRIAADQAAQEFDLANGPLVRARLLELADQDHVLIVTLHGIVADQWSLNVFAYELDALYQSYSAGGGSSVCDLAIEYADYAYWENRRLQDNSIAREIAYWRKRLAGVPPVVELPTDRPRPLQQRFRGDCQCVLFSRELTELLRALSEQEGVELSTILLAAFLVLLFRYSGQDDIVLGSIVHGRNRAETRPLIGLFAHATVVRVGLGGDPSFRELLRRTERSLGNDCQHENVPFDCLLRELRPSRDQSRDPLYRVLFCMAPTVTARQTAWELAELEVDNGTTTVDLQLQLQDKSQGLAARFIYDTDLFDPATIARFAQHFHTLLHSIAANPDGPVSRLRIMSDAERRQLSAQWNGPCAKYPKERCVHQLFEEQVDRVPSATAVVFENQQLTYRELNTRANQLAHYLLKCGIGPDVLVGLCVERSLDMVVGLLGILKAGGAYVPLDPAFPPERIFFMLQDANVSVLLTQGKLAHNLPVSGARVVCLDTGWQEIAKESPANPLKQANSENLAYVMYTSGSTGKPKGVQIPHRAVVNFLTSMSREPGMEATDRMLAVTTVSFDIAGLEIYLPLSVGACVEIASRTVCRDGNELLSKVSASGTTMMQATPATWRMLLEAGWPRGTTLKILCGGEALPRDLASQLLERASSVWNMYGPTETTIWSAISRITSHNGPITIGRPIANTEVYILDSYLEPVPVGVLGELFIGGEGVARGYLHRPELTAEKFIPNPFRKGDSEARLYRTGDLARYLPNGEIECLGRIDHQVKLRGFRIELGEIESSLREHPGVSQNVVVAWEHSPGDKWLVAYVVVRQGDRVTAEDLRGFLRQKLPEYMLPSWFVFLASLPLTPNGKVDRRALPIPKRLETTGETEHAAPGNSIESRLAKIWESVFSMPAVSIHENFFDLGGHSLLAAKLLRRIEHTFHKKLSMAALFEAPTIKQQALILQESSAAHWPSAVVPVQPIGSRPPFFCFGLGAGPVFLPLARQLGYDQPVFGVDPTLLETSQLSAHANMEDIAACLAGLIRGLQPNGPYYLGGLCGGGLVAYETARQLIAQGKEIGLLALFEPHTGHYDYRAHSTGFRIARLSRRLKFHLANLHQLEFKEAETYIRDHVRERSRVLLGSLKSLFWKTLEHLRLRNGQLTGIRNILGRAYHAYRPLPLMGPVLLVQATRREPGGEWEREYWAALADQLEVREIPGHSNWLVRFFMEPNVELLAKIISDHLQSPGKLVEKAVEQRGPCEDIRA